MANHVNLVSCNCLCAIFLLFFLFHKSRNVSKFLTTSIRAWFEWKAMVEDEGKKLGIGTFDSTNFGFWRMQIRDYLYEKKLHLPLLGEQQDDMEDAYWQVLDRHVLGVIRLTLSRTATHNIVKEKTILDAPCCLPTALQTTSDAPLSGLYEELSVNNKVHLMWSSPSQYCVDLDRVNQITRKPVY